MINVIVIALEFAPVQTTGAFRSIALVKYLHKFGFRPIVITINPDDATQIFSAKKNLSLFDGLPNDLSVFHAKPTRKIVTESPLRQYFRILTNLDDTFFKRFESSFNEIIQDIKSRFVISAVYASLPPFGAGQLGIMTAKHLTVPLVLDLRDAWSEWLSQPVPTYWHYKRRLRDERDAFEKASAIITVTKQLRNIFINTHPQIPSHKFHVVPNGFDGPLFDPIEVSLSLQNGCLNIGYVGSFYYTPKSCQSLQTRLRNPHRLFQYQSNKEDWSYRSPLYFFRAWQELSLRNPELAAQIRFHHIGSTPNWLEGMAKDHGIAQYCKFWGTLPKQDLLRHLKNLDAFLATSIKRPDEGDYCLASKTFDYLLAKKPIIGFVNEGAQRDFLIESGVANICNPDDLEDSVEALKQMVQGEARLKLNNEFINKFSRVEMAKQIAAILHKVADTTWMPRPENLMEF